MKSYEVRAVAARPPQRNWLPGASRKELEEQRLVSQATSDALLARADRELADADAAAHRLRRATDLYRERENPRKRVDGR